MPIVENCVPELKGLGKGTSLSPTARKMISRMVLGFILHFGRMSCSAAAGMVASEPVHRGQVSRFLAGRRWQHSNLTRSLVDELLRDEPCDGRYVLIIDATMVSQAGIQTENTFSTGNRQRRPRKGRRYNSKKIARKSVHSFTFALLITPSGTRLPFQIPHYTPQYCKTHGVQHLTTAEAAAELIRQLPLPAGADVVVLGDTAYEAQTVRQACAERGYGWIVPINSERVLAGPKGHRPKVRTLLTAWPQWSPQTIRLPVATGKYVAYRRASRWRIGPKQKSSEYYAHEERRDVQSVGSVRLVFSTKTPNLTAATPETVKILMSNLAHASLAELIELYALRWQIELFFKELKSTLGFAQYRLRKFQAVEGWVQAALLTVLCLERVRKRAMRKRRISSKERDWWASQRLHGLGLAFRQQCQRAELSYLRDRLKTPRGVSKLQRQLTAAIPHEYRVAA